MWETGLRLRLAGFATVVSLGIPCIAPAQEIESAQLAAIPGITAEDEFPAACSSCHVVLPDGMDVRLSTLMRQWEVEVDTSLLAKAQAAAPAGLALVGRHPDAEASLQSIPLGCLTCHGRDATLAPPFARLMHRVHLVGGEANLYLTLFRGECTYCHKLDPESGAWSIPTGPEKQ
jgi:cytochrome c553